MTTPPSDQLPLAPDAQALLTKREGESRQDRMVRLAARLMQVGVSNRQVQRMLTFDLDRVERQLDWLPYRNSRKKSSMIVAAIEQDYEAPANWSLDEDK